MCSSVVCHTSFATCFFRDSVSVVACFFVFDFLESNSSVCSVFSCCNDFVTFFKLEFVFISFKSFTIQDFLSCDSSFCWSCFISVGEGWVVICNCCYKLSSTIIFNINSYCVRSFIIGHTCFTTCFFSNCVSVRACSIIADCWESNSTVCSILSCCDYFVTFFKFKLIFVCFKRFTVQDFSSCDSFFSWFSFINVCESKVVSTCCSCNELTLTVIFNDYCHFISIWIVFNSGYITCFFSDSECTSFFFCERKFWELNLTFCIV